MPQWSNGTVEVNLGELINDGRWMLEVIAPVYGTWSHARTDLLRRMNTIRDDVFGYAEVVDLTNVPIDTPGLKFPDEGFVLLVEVFEPETKRMRYQFIGRPKLDFKEENMTWGEQPAIEAPRPECKHDWYALRDLNGDWLVCSLCGKVTQEEDKNEREEPGPLI